MTNPVLRHKRCQHHCAWRLYLHFTCKFYFIFPGLWRKQNSCSFTTPFIIQKFIKKGQFSPLESKKRYMPKWIGFLVVFFRRVYDVEYKHSGILVCPCDRNSSTYLSRICQDQWLTDWGFWWQGGLHLSFFIPCLSILLLLSHSCVFCSYRRKSLRWCYSSEA